MDGRHTPNRKASQAGMDMEESTAARTVFCGLSRANFEHITSPCLI